jgi:hypothetical protein
MYWLLAPCRSQMWYNILQLFQSLLFHLGLACDKLHEWLIYGIINLYTWAYRTGRGLGGGGGGGGGGTNKASRAIFASQSGNIGLLLKWMGQVLSILWEILSILWEICYLIGIFRNHSSPPPPPPVDNNFGKFLRTQSEKVGQISFHPLNFFLPVRPCLSVQVSVYKCMTKHYNSSKRCKTL